MDFTFTEAQQAVTEAAAAVFGGMVDQDRLAAVEATGDRFDDALWRGLADATLLGVAVPEEQGGSGLGMTELCLLLEAQGRAVAPVPLWATLVLGALPLAAFGTPAQRQRWLPGVVAGAVRLSFAVDEVARSRTGRPVVTAEAAGDGWRLAGRAQVVPQAHLAARVLMPAVTGGGDVVVALVDPAAAGVTLTRAETTDRQLWPHLDLDGVVVAADDVLGGRPFPAGGASTGASAGDVTGGPAAGTGAPADGAPTWPAVLGFVLERAHLGLAALSLGVAEEAVRRTAAYVNEREQFGKPLASFQATMLRAADAYIDTEAMRVTLWEAAWRLDTGRPAADAVAGARWWASEAGQRVVHATQHLHGGIGADVTYPIHRYFLWGKQLELALEGPSAQLARAGRRLAAEATAGSGAGAEPEAAGSAPAAPVSAATNGTVPA